MPLAPAPDLVGVHDVGIKVIVSRVGRRAYFLISHFWECVFHSIWGRYQLVMISVGRLPTHLVLFSHLRCMITNFRVPPQQFCRIVYSPSVNTNSTFTSRPQKLLQVSRPIYRHCVTRHVLHVASPPRRAGDAGHNPINQSKSQASRYHPNTWSLC